jgi:hypothetical protein
LKKKPEKWGKSGGGHGNGQSIHGKIILKGL